MVKLRGIEDYPFYFGARPELLKLAGALRRQSTVAEKTLWSRINNRQIMGFKFRRQHPVHECILDFFCYDVLLAIEVDGEVHNESYQVERDEERTKILNRFGIRVLRFTNEEVENNIEEVVDKIKEALHAFKR